MSVQIIENWSEIRGVVVSWKPDSELHEYSLAEVRIEQVTSVQGYPNLFDNYEGGQVWIFVPHDLIQSIDLDTYVYVECRVRMAGKGRIFVNREYFHIIPLFENGEGPQDSTNPLTDIHTSNL